MTTFKIGDRIIYHGKEYKIDHIKNDGTAKIHSVRGKSHEVIYCAPIEEFEFLYQKDTLSIRQPEGR